jgi:CMP-N-acetylneuraminic acid synthetase
MNFVAIIPARGGSKGIPRKNLRNFNGKPLIAHIIEKALRVDKIDRVIVSTEDEEIAKISKNFGAEVPFLRPETLAQDETPLLPVLQHVVKTLENTENYIVDAIVLLLATSPLMTSEKIEESIEVLIKNNYDSVIGVEIDHGHYWIEENGEFKRFYPIVPKNRQYEKPLLKETGTLYLCRKKILLSGPTLVEGNVGFLEFQKGESIDIDDMIDFEMAEFFAKKRNQKESRNP